MDQEQLHPQEETSRRGFPLSRRQFIAGAAALGAGTTGFALRSRRASTAQSSGDRRTLRLLCWQGYDHGEVTQAFRDQHNVDIQATYLGANDEIFTFLRAGGIGEYDVVTPHNGVVKALAAVDLIDPLDTSLIPNAEALLPRFQQADWVTVDGQVYGVPFLWGTSPMIYNPAKISTAPTSWVDAQATKYRGRVVMTEDGIGHFMIWNGALGFTDPTRVTVSELNQTTDLLISIKRDRAGAYVGPMTDVARLLAAGTVWLSTIGWDSTPYLAQAKGGGLKAIHPKPGDYSYCDNLCVAKNAPSPDLAHAFIDFMISADAQAGLMNRLLRGTINADAVASLSATARRLYTYDDLDTTFGLSPLRGFPPFQDEGDGIATYVDWVSAWERVRFTQMRNAR